MSEERVDGEQGERGEGDAFQDESYADRHSGGFWGLAQFSGSSESSLLRASRRCYGPMRGTRLKPRSWAPRWCSAPNTSPLKRPLRLHLPTPCGQAKRAACITALERDTSVPPCAECISAKPSHSSAAIVRLAARGAAPIRSSRRRCRLPRQPVQWPAARQRSKRRRSRSG